MYPYIHLSQTFFDDAKLRWRAAGQAQLFLFQASRAADPLRADLAAALGNLEEVAAKHLGVAFAAGAKGCLCCKDGRLARRNRRIIARGPAGTRPGYLLSGDVAPCCRLSCCFHPTCFLRVRWVQNDNQTITYFIFIFQIV